MLALQHHLPLPTPQPSLEIGFARSEDLTEILDLLQRAGRRTENYAAHLHTALVARLNGTIVASAALENYGREALVRSVCVDPAIQLEGLGRMVALAVIELARGLDIERLYLLSLRAPVFFAKLGFEPIAREDVPAELRARSIQWSLPDLAEATAMTRAV